MQALADIVAGASAVPGQDALVTERGRVTYTELEASVARLSAVLVNRFPAGSVLAARISKPEVAVLVLLGAATARLPIVMVDPAVPMAETADALRGLPLTASLDDDANVLEIPGLRYAGEPDTVELTSWLHLSLWRFAGAQRSPLPPDATAGFLTSGTTGRPRVVLHSDASLLRTVRALEGAPKAGEGTETWVSSLQPQFIGGASIAVRVLAGRDRLVLRDRFHPRDILKTVQAEQASCLALSPSMLALLLRVPDLDRYDTASLGIVGLGASMLSKELAQRAEAAFECLIVNSYGSTELGGPVLITFGDSSTFTPMPSVKVRITDANGLPVPKGEFGELTCRVDTPMLGAWDAGQWSPFDRATEWIATGDRARIVDTGGIEIVGRVDDAVSKGGRKVMPEEVEMILEQHPEVVRAGVVGRGDGDEALWAFVVTTAPEPSPEELLRHCAGALPAHKRPNRIIVVDDLPTTATGKLRRFHLRDWAALARPTMPAVHRGPE